jgi:DNA anti-recombination protein RmuC
MFENFMAVIQQFRNDVREDLNTNNEKLEQFRSNINSNINSVRADVREEINSIRTELNTNNENLDQFRSEVRSDINSIRADIKAEHEKLLKNCELKNQELQKEIKAKLDSEARRLTNLVGKAKSEFHSELVATKGQMEEESAKLSNAISTVTRCEQ